MRSQNHFAELNWHVLTFLHSKSVVQCTGGVALSCYFQWMFFLRSVSSLNNPQKREMKICEKYEVDMLKIIIIIIGYTSE
jgi:hypothetical protein